MLWQGLAFFTFLYWPRTLPSMHDNLLTAGHVYLLTCLHKMFLYFVLFSCSAATDTQNICLLCLFWCSAAIATQNVFSLYCLNVLLLLSEDYSYCKRLSTCEFWVSTSFYAVAHQCWRVLLWQGICCPALSQICRCLMACWEGESFFILCDAGVIATDTMTRHVLPCSGLTLQMPYVFCSEQNCLCLDTS